MEPIRATGRCPLEARPGITVESVPKYGQLPSENEDSNAVDTATGRVAVSDGASTSARAEVWSRILVDSFVLDRQDPFEPSTLAELRALWWQRVAGPSLPWFAQEKLRQGGAATFAGLEIENGKFRSLALGDSCVFHLRGRKLLHAYPLAGPEEFSRFPALLSTRREDGTPEPQLWEGAYEAGDIFVLATDAVAKYFLHIHELTGEVLPVSKLTRTRSRFVRFIGKRRCRDLDNDDATLCVVRT